MRYCVRAEGRTALLGEGELVIGRSSYCSLVVEHASVSRVHAAVRLVDGNIEVDDLGSSNGTFVRGKRIDGPTAVTPNDELKVGSLLVRIESVHRREAADTSRRIPAFDIRNDDTEFETLNTSRPGDTLGPSKPQSGSGNGS